MGMTRRKSGLVAGMAALMVAAVVAGTALAGGLDPEFGDGGKVVLDVDDRVPSGAAVDDAGRTLVLLFQRQSFPGPGVIGEPVLARLLPDGSLDPDFGESGMLDLDGLGVTPLPSDQNPGASDVALDSDGRIVLLMNDSFAEAPCSGFDYLLRLEPDGSLDESFGEGAEPTSVRTCIGVRVAACSSTSASGSTSAAAGFAAGRPRSSASTQTATSTGATARTGGFSCPETASEPTPVTSATCP